MFAPEFYHADAFHYTAPHHAFYPVHEDAFEPFHEDFEYPVHHDLDFDDEFYPVHHWGHPTDLANLRFSFKKISRGAKKIGRTINKNKGSIKKGIHYGAVGLNKAAKYTGDPRLKMAAKGASAADRAAKKYWKMMQLEDAGLY